MNSSSTFLPQPPPTWLHQAKSKNYLESVFDTLLNRETKRELARAASRQATHRNPISTSKRFFPLFRTQQPQPTVDDGYYSVSIGDRLENQSHNRYLQLEPYNRTRVLVPQPSDGARNTASRDRAAEGRYINANWVLEKFGRKWWIAAQAPLPNTFHSFLTLVLEPVVPPFLGDPTNPPRSTRPRVVVQLTQIIEGGRRKAHAYFPSETGPPILVHSDDHQLLPSLHVTLLEAKVVEAAHCIQSIVTVAPVSTPLPTAAGSLEGDGQSQTYEVDEAKRVVFQHFLYTSWPDHGVPESKDRASLLAFLQLVDEANRDTTLVSQSTDTPDPDPPIIVGCSAGIGRTGSFIALSSLLRTYHFLPQPASPGPTDSLNPSPLGPLPDQFQDDYVVQEVDSLRDQRPGMVQRDEQVVLIYQVLVDAFSKKAGKP